MLILIKNWKNIIFLSLLIIGTTSGYLKGFNDCKKNYTIKLLREVQRRYEAEKEEYEKTEEVKEKIFIDRGKRSSDKRDSCLMSNDPFAVNCL